MADIDAQTVDVLHSFSWADGASPGKGSLITDGEGNLYGTTTYGGATDFGTVFKYNLATGVETVLHAFYDSDGQEPTAALVRDSEGNLYSTTLIGGVSYEGTVFKIDPSGNLTTLYNFTGGNDGFQPYSGAIRDSSGNLYGITGLGGANCTEGVFCGTLWEITP